MWMRKDDDVASLVNLGISEGGGGSQNLSAFFHPRLIEKGTEG